MTYKNDMHNIIPGHLGMTLLYIGDPCIIKIALLKNSLNATDFRYKEHILIIDLFLCR